VDIRDTKLYGKEFKQRVDNDYFLLSSMVKVINKMRSMEDKQRFNQTRWMDSKVILDLIDVLKNDCGIDAVFQIGEYKLSQTWIHPYLFLEAMRQSGLRIEVYKSLWEGDFFDIAMPLGNIPLMGEKHHE